ncbi:MAG TPA: hypothetical protein VG166_05425 [Caulobacteraceae bacterium]|jgi:hypothetical protein|nr:hypothetical protein [Caulobacteraceae bacterium]
MTRLHLLAAAAMVVAPTIVLAQSYNAPPPADTNAAPPAAAAAADTMAPAATASGMNTSTGPVSADQLPAGQANALGAGDNKLVSNGPVPDTIANRHKYGGPMSHAGKRTAPAGN